MATRLELQTLLENILGSTNVYYQPPENVRMEFPAIVYSRERLDNTFSNNNVYKVDHGYKLIYIHDDPDDPIVDTINQLPTCRFLTEYVADDLYHDSFIIYF